MKRVAALLCACLGLCACEAPLQTARKEANQRWGLARAQVKCRLASDQLAAGNLDAARQEAAEALRLEPNSPTALAVNIHTGLARGDFAAAEALLNRPAAETGVEFDYLRGLLRQGQQRWSDAADAFERARAASPHDLDYFVAAVQSALQAGARDRAQELLTSATAEFGWTREYLELTAETCELRGDWSAAAAAWRQVAADPKAGPEVRLRLAHALRTADRAAEALPVLRELVAQNDAGTRDHARLLLGETLLATGQIASAREELTPLLRRQTELTAPALGLAARAAAQSGDYAAALRLAQRAVALAPQRPELELAAALAWRCGAHALARQTADQLVRLDPQNAVAAEIRRRSAE